MTKDFWESKLVTRRGHLKYLEELKNLSRKNRDKATKTENIVWYEILDKRKTGFKFLRQKFEKIELKKNNLVIANFSLPFCNKNNFKELWNKINDSILKDGYFVGNFFGNNDEWKSIKEEMTFLTREQVIELFKDFEIIEFKEVEKDGTTGLGKMKHWHIFNVIAKKKQKGE